MKLKAEIGGKIFDVSITRDGDKVHAIVDGREYHLDASEPELGVTLFKDAGKIHEMFVSKNTNASDQFAVYSENHTFDVKIFDPKRIRSSAGGAIASDAAAEIRSTMPGKVIRILAEPGSQIEKGAGVVVVEAMKMQNEMKSPKTGVVKSINVEEGSTIAAGDILAIID